MKHLTLKNVLLVLLALQISSVYLPFFLSKKDSKLQQIVEKVETNLRHEGLKFKNAHVTLGTLPSNYAGITLGIPFIYTYIVLNQAYFKSINDEVKEALVLHEYTHYLGVRKHSNAYMNKIEWIRVYDEIFGVHYVWRACPNSIMHASDEINSCFYKYKKHYYKDVVQQIIDNNK